MEEVRGPNSNLNTNGPEAQSKIKSKHSNPDKMGRLHDTQKEKKIIPSSGGAEDVLWVDPTIFNFWNLYTLFLLKNGSSLVTLVQKGSIFDDSRLYP